jgi:DNA helicase II / ATP-dependent DNA helicase PcrA
MTEQQLFTWLASQQSTLDELIYKSGLDYFNQNKSKPNFVYDIGECQSESYNLINNQDLCYDRANTAFAYSLWYHARRVNTFLTFFAKKLLTTQETEIEIFDLGAGTGAVQWAVGLVLQAMKEANQKTPNVRIVNIDSSPFMLHYSKEFLWKHFCSKYTHCTSLEIDYEVNSWNNKRKISVSNPWLSASYLFDISDDKEVIKNDFTALVNTYKPTTVLLLTSAQPKKKELLSSLSTEFKAIGYKTDEVLSTSLIFKGSLPTVNKFRKLLYAETRISSIARDASWTDSSFVGTILTKPVQKEIFGTQQAKIETFSLYNPPLKVRRDIELNDFQKKAAKNTNQPTVIVGPAGCGKSVVITERVKNIVTENNYNPNLKILVTSFNKELIKSLGNWISDLLVAGKFTKIAFSDGSSNFKFINSNQTNIQLLHFEMLAKNIGGIKYFWYEESQHKRIIQEIITNLKSERTDLNASFDSVLNPDFILEEYHRVIYGLECYKELDYLEIIREGRGNNPTLQRNSERRKVILECIKRYNKQLNDQKLQSYITRRRLFLRGIESGEIKTKYDYVIVDEFQDCTNADFKIFIKLLKDSNNLILAGDLAQAVHIGNSSRIYRDISMSKREFHRLKGSYRLPVRISECIEEIPKSIATKRKNEEGVNEITPYKGSPPGARPIIVYADTLEEIVVKIKAIFECYKVYDLNKITILEKDHTLTQQLNQQFVSSETDTILRLKGLEKECVLWSTRADIEFEKEVYEFIYTILTRTSSILIVALFKETKPIYKRVINLLRKDRIILWDTVTKQKFNEFCELTEIEILEDEE